MTGLVVDLFAGGGGASVGIEAALGRPIDVAINHDAIALAVHKANHPNTRHLEGDLYEVKPRQATGGRPVDVLWASPDCTHHSTAKGGKPLKQDIRSLAWVVVRWAAAVRPRVIFVENVPEFLGWGPLDKNDRPIKRRKGATFLRWRRQLMALGYNVEHRILDASLFGAPTRRRRVFIVARRDGRPVRWPDPTHGEGLLPLRTAAECIDWSLPCPSIFERKKPLAEKTQWRVAQGIKKFVLENAKPFIVRMAHGEVSPDGTVTRVTTKDHHGLAAVMLEPGQRHGRGQRDAREPLSTVVTKDRHAVAATTLVRLNHDDHGVPIDEPLPTIMAEALHIAEVRAFLTTYYGSDGSRGKGQSLRDPMRTVTAKHRLGLVTIEAAEYQIVDIGLRMLQPHELLRAQFGEFAEGYDLSAARGKKGKRSKSAEVRLIGNSVCPHPARALVADNVTVGGAEEYVASPVALAHRPRPCGVAIHRGPTYVRFFPSLGARGCGHASHATRPMRWSCGWR